MFMNIMSYATDREQIRKALNTPPQLNPMAVSPEPVVRWSHLNL